MLKQLEISGFKSFAKKTTLSFDTPITAIVGPNGSGKSNVVEAIRFVLGEQSMKSLRGKGGSDLIWKGSKMLAAGSKARVGILFDNEDRKFAFSNSTGASADLSFDEITLSREVTDSGSDYYINGTGVRLKDLTELLGSVNIGASGHHIISQGEADRLLSASSKDRRGMIEDALGLKVYQIRIKDSERKLEKTAANMKEVAALRRELAPHLTFLGKQVEKIKQAEELRNEFAGLYNTYAVQEASAIAFAEHKLHGEEKTIHAELATLSDAAVSVTASKHSSEREAALTEIRNAEGEQSRLMREREELGRTIGRIEGKLDALEVVTETKGVSSVSAEKVEALCAEIVDAIADAENIGELEGVKSVLRGMKEKVSAFTRGLKGDEAPKIDQSAMRAQIEKERGQLEARLSEIDGHLEGVRAVVQLAREKLANVERMEREAERESYAGVARRATLEGLARECALKHENLSRRKAFFDEGMKEAEALLGTLLSVSKDVTPEEDTPEKSAERDALHRKVERIKIKLEDAGAASGAEIMKEYEDTKDRDAFLARELVDIEASIQSLRGLIAELRETIERTFKDGIEKINVQFGEFFKLMFGGGSAFLSIVVEHKRARAEEGEEDDDDALPLEHGIEINVSLPHKKVRDLNMLSGGERSLISIALLFAMSQVNPPPFLVLDETDAALDEANSRKYGDMLEHLSKHSKLIVVTHNRETMSRAQVLYGVTMGLEGASKLLSIKFDEAVKIAK
ncbi:MAG: AAA family ATPase [Candidatus Pacebacteria bacterium]|nr:AAA family ATPase [Candidatus Paceibacterota bacterium]